MAEKQPDPPPFSAGWYEKEKAREQEERRREREREHQWRVEQAEAKKAADEYAERHGFSIMRVTQARFQVVRRTKKIYDQTSRTSFWEVELFGGRTTYPACVQLIADELARIERDMSEENGELRARLAEATGEHYED